MASGEITVSIEKTMHQQLSDIANHYRQQHGICIHYVEFDWIGIPIGEGVPRCLIGVNVKSQSGPA